MDERIPLPQGATLDRRRREVVWPDGRAIYLSPRLFSTLEALAVEPGVVRTISYLQATFGPGAAPGATHVAVRALRRLLGQDMVRTRRGVGYYVEKPE